MKQTVITLIFWAFCALNAPAQEWIQTASGQPLGREGGVICYDPILDRTVLFGGGYSSSGAVLDDTWLYDGATSTWSEEAGIVAPPPRRGHAVVFDTRRASLVLHGGRTTGNMELRDTWEHTASGWELISSDTGPRGPVAMAYDANRGQIIAFGSQGGTWSFDSQLGTWKELTVHVTQVPSEVGIGASQSARPRGEAMVYDSGRDRILLYGADGCVFGSSDVWEYAPETRTWSQRPSTGHASPCHIVMTYDKALGRTIAFGGFTELEYMGDTWAFDGATATWVQAVPSPPWPSSLRSYSNSITFDSRRGVVVLNTITAFGARIDTWELSTPMDATWASYGVGCSHVAESPNLGPVPGSLPQLGTEFTLELTGLPAHSGPAMLLVGTDIGVFSGQPLPLTLGSRGLSDCRLWIAPRWQIPPVTSSGTVTFSIQIPNRIEFAGLQLAQQAVVLGSSSDGIDSVSNGGIAIVH